MSTGPNQILLKRSDTATSVPAGLSFGEPGINTASGKLFFQEQIDGTVTGRMLSFHGFTNESFVTDVNGSTGSIAVVNSLNGLTGTALIKAGTNITLTAGAGGITVDAFGAGSNVTSFNGITGAVEGVALFNGATGNVSGLASFNGTTSAVDTKTLHLHVAGLSTDGGITLSGVLDLRTGSSFSGTLNSANGISVGGSTIGGVNIGSNAINASGVVTAAFFSGTATAALSAGSATTAVTATNVSVTATNDSTNYRVPFAAGSESGTVSLGMRSDSGGTTTGLFFQPDIATLSTGIVNPVGISLGSAGITFSDGTFQSTAAGLTHTDENFTAADHTKLNGIEASADVTDAANVTSAGALMDSELTSIADVKALDQSVVSGASPTFGTANFTDASNKRLMTDAQESKLDGIEASADVTDATNVTSAGALMDSELTSIADVKALDQSVVSGANPVFTFISALAGISVGAGGVTFSDGTQTTTALRTDSYTGQIETAADKTYTLDPKVATARTITGFYIKSASGTVTATLKNGSDTIKAASVSSSSGDQSSLANTSVSADAVLTLVTSSNSSALDVIFNVEYTAAL